MKIFFLPLMFLALAPSFSAAGEVPAREGSVYRVQPSIDFPILGLAALGAVGPLFFEPQLIRRKCPCDPRDVNSFDRPVIGNHNETAGTLSHFTVALSVIIPLGLDA